MKCDRIRQIGATYIDKNGAPVFRLTCVWCRKIMWKGRPHAKTCSTLCRKHLSRYTN